MWIVGSALFVIAVAAISYSSIKAEFDAAAIISAAPPLPPEFVLDNAPHPWASVRQAAAIAFGIPLVVLVLGACLVRAFSGFAATPISSPVRPLRDGSELKMTNWVETAAVFKRTVVDRDYADYKAAPSDLRLAYHLALGLFHLRDWTFWEHGDTLGFKNIGDYQDHLENRCPDFGYMRDLANAVKHAELDPSKKPSTQMVGLANTELSFAAFQPGAFQADAFQTETLIVSKTSPTEHVAFHKAADAVKAMWDQLFEQNGWK